MGRKRRNKSTPNKATPETAAVESTPKAAPNAATVEPYWEPLARKQLRVTQTASIVARHAIPLLGVWLFGGSVENFLLLSVFNIALSISCIAVVGLAVSTRQI